jgi:hypothetical protein
MPSYAPLEVDTIAQLKQLPTADGAVVLCVGYQSIGDGRGGFFRFDASSTANEDMTFLNTVASSVTGTGRWLRIFQRVLPTGQGLITNLGGFKEQYIVLPTDSNGRVTCYLTSDGTAAGTATFSNILWMDGASLTAAPSPNDAIVGTQYSLSSDKKELVYQFSRGNSQTLGASLTAILGLVIPGLRAAPQGMQVAVKVSGT